MLCQKKKKCFETSKLTFFAMLARGRRRIQNRGAALMIIYLTEGWSFSFYCKAQDKHFVAPLKNKETDDRNKWLCVRVVNLMDGCMVSLFFTEKIHLREEKKKISPIVPPPVFKMTVNFHPLLQNGCLMINRGLDLRSSSHAGSTHTQLPASAKKATPPRCC